MARFDRPCKTFYWSAIVTIAFSCTVCELFDVEFFKKVNTFPFTPQSLPLHLPSLISPRRDVEFWLRGHWRSMPLVPVESLGAVFYSPSLVTMVVSVAACEIFMVKEWCDLENRVRVRSSLLEMAPFDRSHTSSYLPSIVSMGLSCIVCEI